MSNRVLALAMVAAGLWCAGLGTSTTFGQPLNALGIARLNDLGMSGNGLDVGVALGNDGTLAFRASSGSSNGGVWKRSGGVLITIHGTNFGETQSLSVNSLGTIGYVKPGGPGASDALISRSIGGTVLTISGASFGMDRARSASLGDDNRFMFEGRSSGNVVKGCWIGLDASGFHDNIDLSAAGLSVHGDFAASGAGPMVAFRGTNASGSDGLYSARRDGGAILTLTGSNFSRVSRPSMSGDTVAFSGITSGGDRGIYASSITGGGIITISGLDFASTPDALPGDVALNNNGHLAYELVDSLDNTLVIVARDTFGNPASRLIGIGDSFAGSTVSRLVFDPQGFNDSNDLAFFAELSNGEAGFFLASNVPSPAPAALLIAGGCLTMARRRRRA